MLTYASMAWVSASIPVSAVTLGGKLRVSSKSTSAATGMKPAPTQSIFSSLFSSVMMVKRVTSEPVPAVVGMAMIGRPASVTLRGNL
ncbi:hypothetical protein D9M70_653070 [compost metagenome]